MSSTINHSLRAGFTVSCSDCDATLADSFGDHFDATWKQLPAITRQICKQHWQLRSDHPVIQFHSFSKYRNDVSAGYVRDIGNELRYNVDIFRIMPAHLKNVVIAHEIGHVFFYALKEPIHLRAIEFEDKISCEYMNRHLICLWGYDQLAVDEWLEREVLEGIPHLRSTTGEEPLSEEAYEQLVNGQLLKWGECRGCIDVQTSLSERESLLKSKATFYEVGILPDSQLFRLEKCSLTVIQNLANGVISMADLQDN